eukprot:SAG31_NODE_944_length_10844_cov_11.214053_9_plen_70_part_00
MRAQIAMPHHPRITVYTSESVRARRRRAFPIAVNLAAPVGSPRVNHLPVVNLQTIWIDAYFNLNLNLDT